MATDRTGGATLETELARFLRRERDETLFAFLPLACLATLLALVHPSLAWLPPAVGLCLAARHGLTRYRVAAGLFGSNPAEVREILAHVRARGNS